MELLFNYIAYRIIIYYFMASQIDLYRIMRSNDLFVNSLRIIYETTHMSTKLFNNTQLE